MNGKVKAGALATVTLLVGVGIGSAGGEESASSTPKAAPEPTATVTATPAPQTVTKTVTKEVTPAACLVVIEKAEGVGSVAGQFANTASKFPNLITRAAKAGLAYNVSAMQTISGEVKGLNQEMVDQADRLRPLVRQFNTAKQVCQDKAE